MPISSLALHTILNPALPQPSTRPVQSSPRTPTGAACSADAFDATGHVPPLSQGTACVLSPPRSPLLAATTPASCSNIEQSLLLQQLCAPVVHAVRRLSNPLRQVPAYLKCLMPHITAPVEPRKLCEDETVRTWLAHALVQYTAQPASHFELLHAMYQDSVFAVVEGSTLSHALMRNTQASEAQRLLCLRLLASLGSDLAERDAVGLTPAIIAARQAHDPYTTLLAIKSWDHVALTQCDSRGHSVADALLSNPVPHMQSFMLALQTEGMGLHPEAPQAWRPPLLSLSQAHHLPVLVSKPIGALSVDGIPLSFR